MEEAADFREVSSTDGESSGGEGLTDSCAFGDNMLEGRVELKPNGVSLEDMVSAGVERGAELEGGAHGLICGPESGRMGSEEEPCTDGLEELHSDAVCCSDSSEGEELLVCN